MQLERPGDMTSEYFHSLDDVYHFYSLFKKNTPGLALEKLKKLATPSFVIRSGKFICRFARKTLTNDSVICHETCRHSKNGCEHLQKFNFRQFWPKNQGIPCLSARVSPNACFVFEISI